MEEVLRDSTSTWKEIKTAMKSQGYHTNVGVVRALTSAQDLPTGTDIEGKFDLHVKETEKLRDEVCLHRSDSEDSISCDPPHAHLEYKPSKRKPAKNNPRRGLTSGRVNNNSLTSSGRVRTSFNSSSVGNRSKLTSSFKTTNTINSVNSSLASVDMMDFGVDNYAVDYTMDTLIEIEDSASRRNTLCSSVDNESCSYPSNGFLDWNHDDNSSYQVQPAECCDNGNTRLPEMENSSFSNKDGEAEVQQHCPKRRSWRIEDYDFEPAPAEKPTMMSRLFKRLSSGTSETVSSLLSNMALETDQLHPTGHQYSRRRSHEATTDEVKLAALSLCLHNNRRASS